MATEYDSTKTAKMTSTEWAANARAILDENPTWERPGDRASIAATEAQGSPRRSQHAR